MHDSVLEGTQAPVIGPGVDRGLGGRGNHTVFAARAGVGPSPTEFALATGYGGFL